MDGGELREKLGCQIVNEPKTRLRMKFTTLDYCQYLLSSQINYTVTNLADHLKRCSHDTINLFLKTEKITSRMLWEQVKLVIQTDEGGYLLFDDTVIDKRFAPKIELTRRQYSGNEKRVIRGIGLVIAFRAKDEVLMGIGHRA